MRPRPLSTEQYLKDIGLAIHRLDGSRIHFEAIFRRIRLRALLGRLVTAAGVVIFLVCAGWLWQAAPRGLYDIRYQPKTLPYCTPARSNFIRG